MKPKKERWKGKFVIVIRQKNGQILTWKKVRKGVTLQSVKNEFSRRGTTRKDKKVKITRINLANVREVNITGSDKVPGRIARYQVFATIELIKTNKIIHASSQQHDKSFPVEEAKKEAINNLEFRIAGELLGVYDDDEGKKLLSELSKKEFRIDTGIRFYEDISSNPHKTEA